MGMIHVSLTREEYCIVVFIVGSHNMEYMRRWRLLSILVAPKEFVIFLGYIDFWAL